MGQALPPGLARFTTLPLPLLGLTLTLEVEPVDVMLPQHIQLQVLALCRAAMAEAHKEERSTAFHPSLEAVPPSVLELLDRSLVYHDSGYSADRRRRLMVVSETLCFDVADAIDAAVSVGARTALVASFVLEDPAFAAFLETLNLDAAINRLPSAILADIFAGLVWIERFKATTICRLWRHIALDEYPATVWRGIDTSVDDARLSDYPGGLSRVLALSESADISLNLVAKATIDEPEIVRCGKDGTLPKVFARCAHLHLHLAPFCRTAAQVIFESLSQEMPRLRTFSVLALGNDFNPIATETTARYFSGGAPHLQLVKGMDALFTQRLSPGTRLSAVTQLVLQRTGVLLYEPLREKLAFFPALKHLTLCPCSTVSGFRDEKGDTAWTIALPAQLEDLTLRFYGDDWNYISEIAQALKRNDIQRVWIRYLEAYDKCQALGILNAWNASAPSTVTNMRFDHLHGVVHPRDCDLYWRLPRSHNEGNEVDWNNPVDLNETPFVIKKINVYAWTGDDSGTSELRPCHAILGLPAPIVWPHCAALVLDLTHLSLDETLLGLHRDFLALPKLEVLTIGVLSPIAQRLEQESDVVDVFSSVFFLPREGRREYVFPALRVLKLAVTWHEADGCATRVAPEVVREFIEDHVQYNSVRLEKLVLRGVYVVETIPAEVAALLGHFGDVEWEGPRLEPETTGPMRDMWFD